MKTSGASPIRAHVSRNRCESSSQWAFGVSPRFSAASAAFCPCSSVPVRNHTSSPMARWYRATMSARMVVYAVPTCGASFT